MPTDLKRRIPSLKCWGNNDEGGHGGAGPSGAGRVTSTRSYPALPPARPGVVKREARRMQKVDVEKIHSNGPSEYQEGPWWEAIAFLAD